MPKLKILLVSDYLTWILGTWAKEIVRLGTKHDYYFFSQQLLPYYPQNWETLVQGVDLVHVLSDFDFEKLTIPNNLPLVGSIHHVTNWHYLTPITEKSDCIMVVANEWKEFLVKEGVSPERIYLFYNGVDTNRFYPLGDRSLARQKLGIKSQIPLIGYSAKYTSNTGAGGRKGIDILLKALNILAQNREEFGVLITGPGWDTVVKTLKNDGIKEVYYYPFLPEDLMPTCYNALDLYLVTSTVEGGPVPVLNCMACGVPVVTTPVGIVKDFIQDGVNGLIVPKRDASATAQAISSLLKSPKLAHQIAKAALETVVNYLTWDKTLAGIEDLYEQVWQQKENKHQLSTATLDPVKQRQWALERDSYLWDLKLLFKGHPQEGLQKIITRDLIVALTETPKILVTEIYKILQKK